MADSRIAIRMKATSWNLLRERANNNKGLKGRNGEKRRNDLVKINLPGYLPGAHRVLTVEIYGVSPRTTRYRATWGPFEAFSLIPPPTKCFFQKPWPLQRTVSPLLLYPPPPSCPRVGSRQRARIFRIVVHRCSSHY